jgi:hypothetical protein
MCVHGTFLPFPTRVDGAHCVFAAIANSGVYLDTGQNFL